MASYEACVIQRLHDLPGVPRLLGRYGAFGIVHEHVPGKPLTRDSEVNEEFFPALRHLLTRIHERGVAYIDLEKPGNILLGGDGLPYLIDFQIAFFWPERFLGGTWPLRLVRRMLQKSDMYHLRKHWRRVRPDQLSRKQIAASRCKPWPVRLGNMLFAPLKKLRRMIQGRSRRRRRR
jgi:serine/threonine protein kinase